MALWKPVAARTGPEADDQDQRGRIRSEVSLVSVLASVLDKDGRPALGLTADQFEMYEEGVKQKIEVFEPGNPAAAGPGADDRFEPERNQGAGIRGGRCIAVHSETGAARRSPGRVRICRRGHADRAVFLQRAHVCRRRCKRIIPGDGTALYDAVYLGAQALGRNPAGRRRAIVLVTDAGETTSRADFETARRAALRADALLYTIVVRAVKNEGGRNTAGEHALETIADSTGGAMYFPDTPGRTRRHV